MIEKKQVELSRLKTKEGYIIPPIGNIIITHKEETESGLILPGHMTTDLETVVAIGHINSEYQVGEKVMFSMAKYLIDAPGDADLGKQVICVYPKEKILNIEGKVYYIVYTQDIIYKISDQSISR